MKCIDCNNDCKIDYNKKITLDGEIYHLAVCKVCGKRHYLKFTSVESIDVKFEI